MQIKPLKLTYGRGFVDGFIWGVGLMICFLLVILWAYS